MDQANSLLPGVPALELAFITILSLLVYHWHHPIHTFHRNMLAYSVIRHIVKNDAVKVDPPEIYNWRVFALAAAVCRVHSLR
jgi:hypothetical protein